MSTNDEEGLLTRLADAYFGHGKEPSVEAPELDDGGYPAGKEPQDAPAPPPVVKRDKHGHPQTGPAPGA